MTLAPAAVARMRGLLLLMAGAVALHAGVVVWAALHASRRTWGLISGPGFYVALLPLVGWVLWLRLRRRALTAAATPLPAPARAGARARRRGAPRPR